MLDLEFMAAMRNNGMTTEELIILKKWFKHIIKGLGTNFFFV